MLSLQKLQSLLITSLLLLPSTGFTEDFDLLGDDFKTTIDGEINFGGTNLFGDRQSSFRNSFISLSMEWNQQVRAVLTAKLDQLVQEGELHFNSDFSIGEFIQEAYIEVREVRGSAVAVIVGKKPIPFSQQMEEMPLFHQNPLFELQNINEVYGLTIDFTQGLLRVFDQIELSAFETQSGDLKIGKIDGLSLRLSRMITDNILLTFSQARLGNSHLPSSTEYRSSIGLIAQTDDGTMVGWVEGIYFSNHPQYLESRFGITTGATISVHATTDLIVEYTWLENQLQEFGLGVRTALTERITLGAEIRYRNHFSRKNDVTFGIVLTYTFGHNDYARNYDYLFGDNQSQDEIEDFSFYYDDDF